MSRPSLYTLRTIVVGLALLAGAPACNALSSEEPMGLALIRVSEVTGACPVEDGPDHDELPTNLPYRRAKATASFRASTTYAGGHYISIGYADDEGRLGMIQMEVPKDRGYGIGEYDNAGIVQSIGFAEWKDGTLDFAGTNVTGYMNYFGAEANSSDLPGTVFSLVGFAGKNADNADICRIVAIHASAERERVTPFDPSWIEPRPGLLIVGDHGTLIPPPLDDLSPPSNAPTAPADAPADPGEPPPPITLHGNNSFSSSGYGSSSPCD